MRTPESSVEPGDDELAVRDPIPSAKRSARVAARRCTRSGSEATLERPAAAWRRGLLFKSVLFVISGADQEPPNLETSECSDPRPLSCKLLSFQLFNSSTFRPSTFFLSAKTRPIRAIRVLFFPLTF